MCDGGGGGKLHTAPQLTCTQHSMGHPHPSFLPSFLPHLLGVSNLLFAVFNGTFLWGQCTMPGTLLRKWMKESAHAEN